MPGRVRFFLSILSTDNPCSKRAPNPLGMPLEFSKMAASLPRNADHGADCYAEEQSHLVGTKCRHSFAERVNGPRPVRVKEGVFEGVESDFFDFRDL